jgi:hypothetical protein
VGANISVTSIFKDLYLTSPTFYASLINFCFADNLLMTPSISESQRAFMNSGDCIVAPSLNSFDDADPTPVLPFLGSHEDQKSLPASDINSDKVLFVNSVRHELCKGDASDAMTATSSSFSNECSGIGFLYQVKSS